MTRNIIATNEFNNLRNKIVNQFDSYIASVDDFHKEKLKEIHVEAKRNVNRATLARTLKEFKKLGDFFIEPEDLKIENINPKVVNVDDDPIYGRLFNIVRKTWSMPFNKGFGRRLRFLVFDEFHNSVIGIIGLQSPPADLACRDDLFNYAPERKMELINQTMDIYSLGSIPPYSGLLGGKLVAGLAASDFVFQEYAKKYSQKKTIIDKKMLDNSLVALTTTSAFGRSSIYNRLIFEGKKIAEPIGYTKGYGTVHLDAVYPDIVKLLKIYQRHHGGGYGNGPRQRWQNIRNALSILDLPVAISKHGIKREVFLFRLCSNLESGMKGGTFGWRRTTNNQDFSEFWLNRWALPRNDRMPGWRNTSTKDYIIKNLTV